MTLNVRHRHETMLAKRTRRRLRIDGEYRAASIRAQEAAREEARKDVSENMFREGLARVAAIGVHPKYMSSAQRRRLGLDLSGDDYELARMKYNEELRRRDAEAFQAANPGKKSIQVKSRRR